MNDHISKMSGYGNATTTHRCTDVYGRNVIRLVFNGVKRD